jgi:hypothetical protein
MVASVAGVSDETGDSETVAVDVSAGLAGLGVETGAQAAIFIRNTTMNPRRMICLFINSLFARPGTVR